VNIKFEAEEVKVSRGGIAAVISKQGELFSWG
jgi:hypothetical protein